MILIKGRNVVLASTLVLGFLSTQVVAEIGGATLYSVTHVNKNDNLNVRAAAGVGNSIVTTIPFDGRGVQLLGDVVTIGKSRWVLVKWKGVTGWVSQYFLSSEKQVVVATDNNNSKKDDVVAVTEKEVKDVVKAEKVNIESSEKEMLSSASEAQGVEVAIQSSPKLSPIKQDTWVLQCGNKMPFWKVEVHPKFMNVLKGDYEADLPITKKKQDRNRWNTALKTVVHGRNGKNNLKMTIKYAYSKRCYDTLSGLRVPYKVTTQFNGEELTGCCRAVKLDLESNETKLSMR